MPAHHYPFIDLAVHAAVRNHFAKGDAVAVLSRDLGEVLWANGAAAHLLGFSNIYDALDEGFGSQPATRRQIESAVSGLGRTGRPQNFMMRVNSGFSRSMAPATLDAFTLPDGAPALLLTSSQAGQVLAPGARARKIIAGFEGTGTHVAVLDKDGQVLAASSTFGDIGLATSDIDRMVADVTGAGDRLVKRMTASPIGAMPTAIGRLADDPALHLLFAVEPAPVEDTVPEPIAGTTNVVADTTADLAEAAPVEQPQDEATETASFAAGDDTSMPVAPANEDAPAKASEEAETDGAKAEDPATSTNGGRRITFFDTRRIRDELNARLAKAERESILPAPFEEASGLVLPTLPGEAGSDEPGSDTAPEDTVVEDAAPEKASNDDLALSSEQDVSVLAEETGETIESSAPEATEAEDAALDSVIVSEGALAKEHDASDLAEQPIADTGDSAFENTAAESAEAEDTASGEQALSAEPDVSDDAEVSADIDENTEAEAAGPESAACGEEATIAEHQASETADASATEDESDQIENTEAEDAVSEDTGSSDEAGSTGQDVAAVGEIPSTAADDDNEGPLNEPAGATRQFRFDPESKPARFVWKINKDGEFSEVSPEFATAVGPHSADILGRKFPDLARVFNLDPDHVITDLLNRRDTWSGKTVFWPIQGTDLVTPVDLAALPTYTRDRRFDGFRGFGIVRTGETRKDPEALGLALVPGGIPRPMDQQPQDGVLADDAEDFSKDLPASELPDDDGQPIEDHADLETLDLESDVEDLARLDGVDADGVGDETGEDDANETETSEPGHDTEDPFRGERPAIRLVETPMRRDSDKVIDLETRRPRLPKDGLSPGEQAAFREIGVRLSNSPSPNRDLSEKPSAAEQPPEEKAESAAPALPQDQQTFGKRQASENDGQPVIDNTHDAGRDDDATEASLDEEPAEIKSEQPEITANVAAPETPAAAIENDAPSTSEEAATGPLPIPSAFALPTRQAMPTGMNAGIIDAIPAALLIHSGDTLIHANSEFFELTGYATLDELSECGGLDHLLDRPTEGDSSGDSGLFVRRGDGSKREITARLRSVNWDDGQALLLALSPRESPRDPVAAVIPDSPAEEDDPAHEPDTRAHDNALQIEAEELRSILETATDGVVILNNDGSIRSMNGSACALFNYDDSETHDEPFAMLFAHESQRAVMDYVSGLSEHGVSSVLNDGREVIGREASGGFLPLFMTIGRLTGSNGYCAVLRDITNWKRTEEELRNAKRAAETANSHKSDFLARVSHEIRTPLNAIIGFSEMMVEERFGPIGSPRYLEYAHDIGNSGKHVLDIVNDLLDISKIEAGQVSMEFVSVSLNDHLAETVSLLQPMANSQRVIIRTSLSASVPEVVADQRSIKQIALNLLSNAIRYTPSGGQIVVSTSYEASGNVVIRIRDTGIGMNRKELEQAMKPFGQVGPGPRQRGDGTGLGLPLTKAMVEANRAQFDIVSAPGEGTLVSISFPPQRVLAD